jgi:glucosyl-3-phosphoglycerate synthase
VTPEAALWFRSRTSRWQEWSLRDLLRAKADRDLRVSVVIPAKDEQETIGNVVTCLRSALMDEARGGEGVALVDELVVMDSDSLDATSRVAAEAGATVHVVREVLPELGWLPGKGEALWKSLFVTTGDVLVFVDADLTLFGPHFVTGLLGPLLAEPDVLLVKGFYDRIFDAGDRPTTEGGRVTELVARPLLDVWWPDLAAVVQPLAGEWAARRTLMESLAVPAAYGVELASLLDTYARWGLNAIAQVDLGARAHRHQAVHDLAVMAAELMVVADRRRPGTGGKVSGEATSAALWQYVRGAAADPAEPDAITDRGPTPRHTEALDDAAAAAEADGDWRCRPIPLQERPPAAVVRQLTAAQTVG